MRITLCFACPRCLAVGRRAGWGLGATWWALVAFYVTRLAGHSLHFWRTGGGVFAGRPLAGGSSNGGGGGGGGIPKAKAV